MRILLCLLAGLFLLVAACDGSPAPLAEPADSAPSTSSPPEVTATASGPRRPVVVLDPGHGGPEIGAANHGVVEKESNLDMALRVEQHLRDAGVDVVLTRREDARVAELPASDGGVTFGETRVDLQARVDMANDVDADLFVSIHSNGSTDQSLRGIEVYYDPNREFSAENQRLAEDALAGVVGSLATAGYQVLDRGTVESSCIRFRNGRCFPLFVLGPPREYTREQLVARGVDPSILIPDGRDSVATRSTEMPGILVELLFISNAADAAILNDPVARDAMARGLSDAIVATLAER
jgi:N-acetylmuramoyl-L-alanine amidase